jgi:hypothetical protein
MKVRLKNKATRGIGSTKKTQPCILIFKTDIKFQKDFKKIGSVLNDNPSITCWNVDRNDIDKVLRVVTTDINSTELINMVKKEGYFCEELPD